MKKLLTLLFAVAIAFSLTTSTFAQDTMKKDDTKKEEKKEKKAKKEKKEKKDDKMKRRQDEGRQEIACSFWPSSQAPAACRGSLFAEKHSLQAQKAQAFAAGCSIPYKKLTIGSIKTVVKSALSKDLPRCRCGESVRGPCLDRDVSTRRVHGIPGPRKYVFGCLIIHQHQVLRLRRSQLLGSDRVRNLRTGAVRRTRLLLQRLRFSLAPRSRSGCGERTRERAR